MMGDKGGMEMRRRGARFQGLVFLVFGILALAGWATAAPVPDTGVTNCYDMNSEIPCPEEGEPFYGQDGCYLINPPSYTKLDERGNALPDEAESWVMVMDNVTRLIWEVKRNKDGTKNYTDPRDADNRYTWYDPDDPNPGTPGNGTDTQDFIDALNAARFGEFDEWRLPTIEELAFLVRRDIPYPGPTIDTKYFPNTVASIFYWSGTTVAGSNPSGAKGIHFDYGQDGGYVKSDNYCVRAVRSGQDLSLGDLAISSGEGDADGRYTGNGDGTVTDTITGLMWQQDTARDGGGNYDRMPWDAALACCKALRLGGHTDWRLPNIKELLSLVDHSRYNPAIDTNYFPNTVGSDYWSSTTLVNDPGYAGSIHFHGGFDNDRYGKDYDGYYVRAVRGGQSGPLGPLALFSAQPTGGPPPLEVAFTDASTGTITTWAWDFGDGGTSTLQNPSHIYIDSGAYTVTLTVTGPDGTDEERKADYIVVRHAAPQADFLGTPTTGKPPLIVDFTDASTGTVDSWAWDFGDGGTSTTQNPTHTYTVEGTYTVTLTVTGPGGSDTETKTGYITVTEPPPVAGFSGNPLSGTVPLEVHFTDASTGTVDSWAWDFGDGGTSTTRDPTHTYTEAGTYTVTLTVTGPGGSDTETKTGYITVTGSGCPAEQAVNGHSGKDREGMGQVLDTLRRFRDQGLSNSAEGRAFVVMYAKHGAEVSGILYRAPGLAGRIAGFLVKAAGVLRGQTGAEGAVIPTTLLSECRGILDALKGMGSEGLRKDIAAVHAYLATHTKSLPSKRVEVGL